MINRNYEEIKSANHFIGNPYKGFLNIIIASKT